MLLRLMRIMPPTCFLEGVKYPARILRDTGSSISFWVRPIHVNVGEGEYVLIKEVTGSMTVPLIECNVECEPFAGMAKVGIVDGFPESGVDLIVENDLVRVDAVTAPALTKTPVLDCDTNDVIGDVEILPACAVTRSMFQEEERHVENSAAVDDSTPVLPTDVVTGDSVPPDNDISLCDTFMADIDNLNVATENKYVAIDNVDVNQFRDLQAHDSEIQKLRSLAVESLEEKKGTCFFIGDDVLWRRWRPPHVHVDGEMWDCFQIVVPGV